MKKSSLISLSISASIVILGNWCRDFRAGQVHFASTEWARLL